MDDGSGLFKQYEGEYVKKATDIATKTNVISSLAGELRRKKVAEVEKDITEADSLVKRMEMEARSVPPERAQPLVARVKEYKADLAASKEAFRKAQAAAPSGDAARAELGLGVESSAVHRNAMLSGTQKLEQTQGRLVNAKQMLAESEDLGHGILGQLATDREKLLGMKQNLSGVDDNITKARNILSRMAKAMFKNKLIMACIALMLVGAIILIVVLKLKK